MSHQSPARPHSRTASENDVFLLVALRYGLVPFMYEKSRSDALIKLMGSRLIDVCLPFLRTLIMPSWSQTFLPLILLLLSFISCAFASIQNITVDDTFGDSSGFSLFTLIPPEAGYWNNGPNCTKCTILPDISQCVDEVPWRDCGCQRHPARIHSDFLRCVPFFLLHFQ